MVNPIMEEYVRRHVQASREARKNFFIFEIDSDGGDAKVGIDLAEFIRDLASD